MTYCNQCGATLAENTVTCPHCGGTTSSVPTYDDYVAQYRAAMAKNAQKAAQPVAPVAAEGSAESIAMSAVYAPSAPQSHPVFKPKGERKAVVEIKGLYKKYSKKANWAVENVSFKCYEGEIIGLLGHNGAGKSTTLKCLEGMLPYERGTIRINGFDVRRDSLKAKACMGFVTDDHATFLKMTGIQYITFMADVYRVPNALRYKRLAALEKVFQLGDAINDLISSYSHGMRQKICMMGSLIHHPKLWILDEPMTGLDPRTMAAVRQFMYKYAAAGNAIIFSSHALNTVAQLCDRVVLIRKGQQINDINVKRIFAINPNFDFEEYFLKNERQN